MNIKIKQRVDLMSENFYLLKKNFKWDNGLINHFSALIHSINDKTPDVDKIKEIKDYIKAETNFTSYFRGNTSSILATLLSSEEDYRSLFKTTLEVYEQLKSNNFKRGLYLPLTSYTIAKEITFDTLDYRISRMREFYNNMKEKHFWLTSDNDYIFAAILGISDLDVNETNIKMETCYKLLNNKGLSKGNDLQTLSHILALGAEDEDVKCTRAIELYESMAKEKCKLHYSALSSLGVLTLIGCEASIAKEIKEVYEYINSKPGYGLFSIDKTSLVMLSTMVISSFYVDNIKKGVIETTLMNSISSIILAQQQAAIAVACAAGAAAAASSSS